ncbi:MAG: hypothetical protein K0S39_4556, partial [Paenibacillus sp.]|nr:hypothetical protein [Paenibacillus sp.]
SLLNQSIPAAADKHIEAAMKLPGIIGYKLKAFVWDNTTNKTLISNVVTIP